MLFYPWIQDEQVEQFGTWQMFSSFCTHEAAYEGVLQQLPRRRGTENEKTTLEELLLFQ